MDKKPSAKKGLSRIWSALIYSLNGLHAAINGETAFRQEMIIYLLLLIALYLLPLEIIFKVVLLLANTVVLIIELLNSAIESAVDIASPEYNDLARRAKDMASAAVFISIVLAILLWVCAIYLMLNGQI